MPNFFRTRVVLLTGLLMLAGACAHAQGGRHGGGGPGGPGGGMGMPGGRGMDGGMGMPHGDRGRGLPTIGSRPGSQTTQTTMAGRWWDDRDTAKSLGLNTDQRKRMDTVFSQNRDVLQQRYEAFVKAQAKLEAMKHDNSASESALFNEIQHTAQARAELEQAYTHLQLQLRNELTPEQASKLEEQH